MPMKTAPCNDTQASRIDQIRSHLALNANPPVPPDELGANAPRDCYQLGNKTGKANPNQPNRLYGQTGWVDKCGIRDTVQKYFSPAKYLYDNDFSFARFEGLPGFEAKKLLRNTLPLALQDRQNNAPRLVTFLQIAAQYPSWVWLSGYLVGQSRFDERLTVDAIFIRDQLDLNSQSDCLFGKVTPYQAWQTAKQVLELNDALYPPDEIYYSHPQFSNTKGGWTLWWD